MENYFSPSFIFLLEIIIYGLHKVAGVVKEQDD